MPKPADGRDRPPRFPWYAIAGAPSSGKTTVVRALGRLGFVVVDEAARQVLDDQRASGRPDAQITDDVRAFHDEVLRRNVDALAAAAPADVTFFDRTLVDSLAYAAHHGWPTPAGVPDDRVRRLARAFIMDPLPWRPDGVRHEGGEFAALIDPIIDATYRRLGVPVTRIPVAPVPTRVELILSIVSRDP